MYVCAYLERSGSAPVFRLDLGRSSASGSRRRMEVVAGALSLRFPAWPVLRRSAGAVEGWAWRRAMSNKWSRAAACTLAESTEARAVCEGA